MSLIDYLTPNTRWVVITGAGISTASGIPAYRDSDGKWLGGNPIHHNDFVQHHHARQRYWHRSMHGWPIFSKAQSNSAHHHLVTLEELGLIESLVTQNVDGLHQRAGQQRVEELHGGLSLVRCLDCDARFARADIQRELLAANAHYLQAHSALRPDGDAALSETQLSDFKVPTCHRCAGSLIPDVVFFGAAVAKSKVARINDALQQADGLLVLGSSLMVYSSYRFCLRAAELDKPLIIVNQGKTRADNIAHALLATDISGALQNVLSHLQRAT